MSDIARRCGVSAMTVSRILRNDRRHQGAVKEKVMQAVQALGYHKNPFVAELMSRVRRGGGRSRVLPTIALLQSIGTDQNTHPNLRIFRDAVRARSADMGCVLAEFPLLGENTTPERLMTMLRTRGVSGLIFEHVNASKRIGLIRLNIDLSEFALVGISHSVRQPQMNRICSDSYGNTIIAFTEMRRLGFRRIGMVESAITHLTNQGRRTAAMREMQAGLPAGQRLPILILPFDGTRRAKLTEWCRQYRPDAVLSNDSDVADFQREQAEQGKGVAFEFVNLGWHEGFAGRYGIDANWPLIGVAAVNALIDQLNRHELGAPSVPRVIEIPGRWVESAVAGG